MDQSRTKSILTRKYPNSRRYMYTIKRKVDSKQNRIKIKNRVNGKPLEL